MRGTRPELSPITEVLTKVIASGRGRKIAVPLAIILKLASGIWLTRLPWLAGQACLPWCPVAEAAVAHRRPARQVINEVWRSILLNKFSKKIVFTMNGVDRGTLK